MKKIRKKESGFHAITRMIGRSTFQVDIDYVKTNLCLAIKDTIKHLGLTQKVAASLAKVGVKTISNVVHGRIEKFSMEKLLRILGALDSNMEFNMTISDVPLSE